MTIQACANIVHRADPARWRAAMAAPVAARDVLLPIYAANSEISRAPWVTQEPFIALMRLQWWRDVLDELQQGTPRRHEVVDALATLPRDCLPPLMATIDARQADVDKDAFETVDALASYARDTTYGAMAGAFLGTGGAALDLPKILDISTALGLGRVLQAAVDLKGVGWDIFGPNWTDDMTRDAALMGLNCYARAQYLRSPACIEAAGADVFLKYISKHPRAVHDGSVPAFGLRTAVAQARYAWTL